MNVGLGNLFSLKTHLLGLAPGTSETRFDQVIQDIGLGVAAQMENFCDRKFCRVAGDQFVCMADRASFVLPRYPLEEITLLEFKFTDKAGWITTGDDMPKIISTSLPSGVVYLEKNTDAGDYLNQIRLTYTAGFFFETLEPTDGGYPSQVPGTATLLPNDLKFGWLAQCRRVWGAFDKIGAKIVDNSAAASQALAMLDWTPEARELLKHYRRMQLV